MTPAVRELLQRDTFSPYRLANIAARYDLSQLNSLVYDGSNRVQLVGDLSGNSAVNGLVLNGVSGNYASSPDSAAVSITGDIQIIALVAPNDWAAVATQSVVAKYNYQAGQRSWNLDLRAGAVLNLNLSQDGTTVRTGTWTTGYTGSTPKWIKVEADLTDGSNLKVYWYDSPDGATWTLRNTNTLTLLTALLDNDNPVLIGRTGSVATNTDGFSGIIHRVQVYNGIGGTLVFDADFTCVAKLATSFTESSSNAATVTINTSGRFGARICGARDRVNMTVAEQPVLTIASGGNYLTYDGSNDCMASAPFPYAQPESVYFVGSIITQGENKVFYDGLASAEVMECYSRVTTFTLVATANGATELATSVPPLSTRLVIRALFNGLTNSSVGLNLSSATTGSVGATTAANGIIVGARSSIGAHGNITESELILRSAADSAPLQARIAAYLIRKWRVTLP